MSYLSLIYTRKNSCLPVAPVRKTLYNHSPTCKQVLTEHLAGFRLLLHAFGLHLGASVHWPMHLGCLLFSVCDATRGLSLGWCWSMPYVHYTSLAALHALPWVRHLLRLALRPFVSSSSVSLR